MAIDPESFDEPVKDYVFSLSENPSALLPHFGSDLNQRRINENHIPAIILNLLLVI